MINFFGQHTAIVANLKVILKFGLLFCTKCNKQLDCTIFSCSLFLTTHILYSNTTKILTTATIVGHTAASCCQIHTKLQSCLHLQQSSRNRRCGQA